HAKGRCGHAEPRGHGARGVVDDYVAGSCAPLPTLLSMALSSGMQDPQFVPARKVVPISAMLVARRLAIASCSAFRPTPKQAQMVRPGERTAQGPSGLPARSNVRISGSIFVPKS